MARLGTRLRLRGALSCTAICTCALHLRTCDCAENCLGPARSRLSRRACVHRANELLRGILTPDSRATRPVNGRRAAWMGAGARGSRKFGEALDRPESVAIMAVFAVHHLPRWRNW
ncbi:hypothetical protein BN2475_130085 [Paraburkholderia ribeironis]|uniref:Uncharacterized protein n=1 Tax=Paraburkholderia ribeironis TaxID=1247936 RepID=A0A1N7RSH5_9BURK|nr:hypothetical protein BN2475_130085 [Paraburkholderia ribeironis]